MQKFNKINSEEYKMTVAFLAAFSALLAVGFLIGAPQLGISFAMLAAILFGLTGPASMEILPDV